MDRDDHPASVISPASSTRTSDSGPVSVNSSSPSASSSRRRRSGPISAIKTFVLDTNVLLHDPACIHRFAEHHICIPVDVLSELDRFKNEMTERGANAREVHRALMKIFANKGASVTNGVPTDGGGSIRVVVYDPDVACEVPSVQEFQRIFPALDKADHRILACTLWLREQVSPPVILVSKDLNMQLKARAVGIECEDYLHDKVEPREVANFDIARVEVSPTNCSASPAAADFSCRKTASSAWSSTTTPCSPPGKKPPCPRS
jgi:PhoH-like ATPase